jgi:hypothetical protein
MTIKQKGRHLSFPLYTCNDIGPLWSFGNQSCFDPGILEQTIDIFDAEALVAGGIGGIEADKILEYFNGALVDWIVRFHKLFLLGGRR